MQSLREQVQRLAPHDTPVLLTGERGSGREVVARYLHAVSSRASHAFVQLLPASVSDENAAAELRGIEDASGVRSGILDQAQGGVLFIKGLEDLTPTMQRLLLADLTTKSYTRVGGRETIPLNVRLLSSAAPGFESAANGEFRSDLLAHVNGITLSVPPLRDYAEDVPELLRYHIDRLVDEEQLPLRHLSVAAQNRLRNYPWPGNVSELRNLVRRLLILGGTEEIQLSEVERQLAAATPTDEPLVKQDLLALPLREAREQFERAYLQQQLILCNGKVGQLAKRVGMERTHLYRKLRSLGVDFRQLADD
jgi:DNA-binding NtrC family response regulator